MISSKILPYGFILVIISLFLYTFTQVDLSLTLSQASIFQDIEKVFQQIGYFNRPLSSFLYLVIISIMFLYYIYFLNQVRNKKIDKKTIRNVVIATTAVLAFSYVAFSHDMFNYIFDAKIITYYHQNPYFHKALDYPGDPMLSFMHWTHRLYPYGPFWLVVTVPFSFIGANIFLVTFFLFKFLAAGFYLGSVYFVYKINQKINNGKELFNTVLFALNPLVIIEALVSSHNDISMIFFALFGIYLYLVKNKILGIGLVILSAMIKIPTAVILLPMIINLIPVKKFHLSDEKFIWSLVLLSIAGLFYSMTKLEIQPWYFLWVLPFAALLKPNKYVVGLIIGVSLGLLLRYAVFLYYGYWDGSTVPLRNGITLACIIASLLMAFVWERKKDII